jgi:hypothetical protein
LSLLDDAHEYVLHHIGGVLLRSGTPQREAVETRRRSVVELFERREATGGEV